MHTNLANIRKDYKAATLSKSDVTPNPITQLENWLQQAQQSNVLEHTAMTLATATIDGVPSARTVLLKGITNNQLVFYTNYNSQKGVELTQNPRACLQFFWPELERQIRITGLVTKVETATSDHYFSSRPVTSQIGALSSPQSSVIPNRAYLENIENNIKQQYKNSPIQRPAHWGGYQVQPVAFEFWQGRPSRLHDRIYYTLLPIGDWQIERLAP